jgi:hypothetical protein
MIKLRNAWTQVIRIHIVDFYDDAGINFEGKNAK